eukprot:NODE_2948_length_476_cov_43.908309_g2898_i0.p1 GENE.NODE_2948_length_476_cov_43.908309_g2898_i0~~NODE_2948_length_476_cov_43.908309_g2898_i0.p1  ORF type:complete len:131 (+),score=1.36 NODE_2948_length_476_cov_43.908309_g2898_i0:63-455(+)
MKVVCIFLACIGLSLCSTFPPSIVRFRGTVKCGEDSVDYAIGLNTTYEKGHQVGWGNYLAGHIRAECLTHLTYLGTHKGLGYGFSEKVMLGHCQSGEFWIKPAFPGVWDFSWNTTLSKATCSGTLLAPQK